MKISEGTKVTEIDPQPHWINDTLLSKGFAVGDLVSYSHPAWNNHMVIYRIVQDHPPNHEAVWGIYRDYSKNSMAGFQMGWTYPDTKKRMPWRYVQGCIEIEPVYQIIRGPYRPSKKTVEYRSLRRIKKLDVLELGRTYAGLKDFIEREIIFCSSE